MLGKIFHNNLEFYWYRIELTSVGIDIRMKHFADKSDSWGFIWVLFRKTWNITHISYNSINLFKAIINIDIWTLSFFILFYLLMVSLNVPSSNGVSCGPNITAWKKINVILTTSTYVYRPTYIKAIYNDGQNSVILTFHSIILLSPGAPETPAGGSS